MRENANCRPCMCVGVPKNACSGFLAGWVGVNYLAQSGGGDKQTALAPHTQANHTKHLHTWDKEESSKGSKSCALIHQ